MQMSMHAVKPTDGIMDFSKCMVGRQTQISKVLEPSIFTANLDLWTIILDLIEDKTKPRK